MSIDKTLTNLFKEKEIPEEYMTFEDWGHENCIVKKGSKATYFDGVAYFHESQVIEDSVDWAWALKHENAGDR